MESELDNLLSINDMYQDTIKGLDKVLKDKDVKLQEFGLAI